MPAEFGEDSPYDIVSFDGKTTINFSNVPLPEDVDWPWYIVGIIWSLIRKWLGISSADSSPCSTLICYWFGSLACGWFNLERKEQHDF